MVENSQKIIDWSIEHSKEMSLKAEYYTGLKLYAPNLFDIGISISVNNKIYYGRGSDIVEEVAYCKALSEAIERAALKIYDIENTNGLAVHPVLDDAKNNAKNELIERDAFLCHYLLKKGFDILDFEFKEVELFLKDNININFYELCNYSNNTGVMCVASGINHQAPFGLVIGSAFGDSILDCGYKALIEVMRGVAYILETPKRSSLNETEFNELTEISFKHHGELALNVEYCKNFLTLINSNKLRIDNNVPKDSFEFEELSNDLFPIANMPLYIVRCKNKKIQNLYSGHTEPSKINLQRLSEVNMANVLFNDVNLTPHPFD
jgi:hypothetical protein